MPGDTVIHPAAKQGAKQIAQGTEEKDLADLSECTAGMFGKLEKRRSLHAAAESEKDEGKIVGNGLEVFFIHVRSNLKRMGYIHCIKQKDGRNRFARLFSKLLNLFLNQLYFHCRDLVLRDLRDRVKGSQCQFICRGFGEVEVGIDHARRDAVRDPGLSHNAAAS